MTVGFTTFDRSTLSSPSFRADRRPHGLGDQLEQPGLHRSPRLRRGLTTAALEASLALFVSVACLSLLRIFVDTHLQTPILIGLAAGLGVPAMARILHVPSWFSLIASTTVEAMVLGVWFTNQKSLPLNLGAADAARNEMISALQQVNRIVAPSPSLVGFGVIVGLVAWMVSLTADLMCFGIPAPIGALLTPSAVAISAAILAPGRGDTHQGAWSVALVVSLCLYLISVGLHERARRTPWFGNDPGSLLASALVLGLTFLGLALVAGTASERLAIDELKPSFDWRVNEAESKQRVITSPLVSLQRRILKQSDDEQFSVMSRDADGNDRSSYWRLTALDEFNGESWQSTGEFRKLADKGNMRSPGTDRSAILTQKFLIAELGTESLPVAYAPTAYRGTVEGVSFSGGTDTLLAKGPLKRGVAYEVTSSTPQNLELDDLGRYDVTPANNDPNIQLPGDFPDRVRRLAVELTKNQSTTVEKARALQDFFRTQFEYTLDVPPGSSESALVRFLFTDRRGYCEQFAGAFAAMARSIGIPTRVAVGFTPGRYDPFDRSYHVTGKNAHAWPEVRLGDGSWFPFEPTPGRGFPGVAKTTGVDPQDLSEPSSPGPAATLAPVSVSPTTLTPAVPGPLGPLGPPEVSTKPSSRLPLILGVALMIAIAFAVLYLARRRIQETPDDMARPQTEAWKRSRPEIRVEKAWKLAATKVGAVPQRTETELAAVSPLVDHYPELPELVTLIQRARYASESPAAVTEAAAVRAEELSMAITRRAPSIVEPSNPAETPRPA